MALSRGSSDELAGPAGNHEWLPASRRALRGLTEVRRALAELERELVLRGRRDGASWRELAADVGVSRTTLRSRHAPRRASAPARSEGWKEGEPGRSDSD